MNIKDGITDLLLYMNAGILFAGLIVSLHSCIEKSERNIETEQVWSEKTDPGTEDSEIADPGTEDSEIANPGTEDPEIANPGTEDSKREDQAAADFIRVLILNENDTSCFHDRIVLDIDGKQTIIESSEMEPGQECKFRADGTKGIYISSLTKGSLENGYAGEMLVRCEHQGLVMTNILPIEEYLYDVVPGEMPGYFPLEAQKAQAVCARTFAYNCVRKNKNKEYDLDDSSSCQVYHRIAANENSRKAVEETKGEILLEEELQYYSASCLNQGRTDLADETMLADFLKQVPDSETEFFSPWVRWNTVIEKKQILNKLNEVGTVLGTKNADPEKMRIKICDRYKNGQAVKLAITVNEETIYIDGEYEIRKILGDTDVCYVRNDGSVIDGLSILPSAFIVLYEMGEYCEIYGGGFGHGNGMSQNGAAAMAEQGMNYQDILKCYYDLEISKKEE